ADDRLLDDEGRSALTLRVERPLGERWSVVVHGGVWASPFASGPDFSRQLALAGFSYSVAD
ncbi:MAG: hypothetical protein KC620_19030, partial [Myxococcales bacterium]|nr:hypothetical protein [Myxococcales bacterium]